MSSRLKKIEILYESLHTCGGTKSRSLVWNTCTFDAPSEVVLPVVVFAITLFRHNRNCNVKSAEFLMVIKTTTAFLQNLMSLINLSHKLRN